ncbi:MAG TPA: hypothetical protein VGK10_15810 [Prolixibacteraceae bacterium]|jgi:hypothetical protein
MIRKIALLICVLSIISCEKEESIDLLTNGTWVLDSKFPYTIPETIQFNSDGTYVQEAFLSDNYMPGSAAFSSIHVSKVQLSGDWSMKNNDIQFIHTTINFPKDTADISDEEYSNGHYKISITPGADIGGFFGYRYLGTSQNDSIPVDSLKIIIVDNKLISSVVGNDSIVPVKDSDQWTWAIIKLTKNALVVNSYGKIQSYHHD